MIDSGHGLLFAIAKVHGLIGSGFIIVIHAIVGVAARYPDTPQSPRVFQGSLDGVHKLFVVSLFLQL